MPLLRGCIPYFAPENTGVSSKLPGPRLKKLVQLSQRKDALLAELQDIEREMVRLEKERLALPKKRSKGRLTISNEARKIRFRSGKRISK